MENKKSSKADLTKNVKIYTLAGLAFMLLLSWQSLEYETKEVHNKVVMSISDIPDESQTVPITVVMAETPPPMNAPDIKIIEPVIDNTLPDDFIEDTNKKTINTTEPTTSPDIEQPVDPNTIGSEVGVVDPVIDNIPNSIVDVVPIYPGCEKKKNNADRKKCLEDKLNKYVQRKFDTNLANQLGLTGRQKISVLFKIDTNGNVVDVQSKANHKQLQQEANNVIKSLPKMTPGKHGNKPVNVIYTLPINFEVQ